VTLGPELLIIGAIAYQVHFPEESRHTGDIDFAAGPKLREAKQVTWPISQFTMSLVGFDHVFTTAQPVPFAPDLTLKVISSTALMLLKIVAFMDDRQRRVKDTRQGPR
jgi:hypothetical protein